MTGEMTRRVPPQFHNLLAGPVRDGTTTTARDAAPPAAGAAGTRGNWRGTPGRREAGSGGLQVSPDTPVAAGPVPVGRRPTDWVPIGAGLSPVGRAGPRARAGAQPSPPWYPVPSNAPRSS